MLFFIAPGSGNLIIFLVVVNDLLCLSNCLSNCMIFLVWCSFVRAMFWARRRISSPAPHYLRYSEHVLNQFCWKGANMQPGQYEFCTERQWHFFARFHILHTRYQSGCPIAKHFTTSTAIYFLEISFFSPTRAWKEGAKDSFLLFQTFFRLRWAFVYLAFKCLQILGK